MDQGVEIQTKDDNGNDVCLAGCTALVPWNLLYKALLVRIVEKGGETKYCSQTGKIRNQIDYMEERTCPLEPPRTITMSRR